MEHEIEFKKETLRDMVIERFGVEMINKVLENPYLNNASNRKIFDTLFNDFYSKKTGRIVQLNLAIDIDKKCSQKEHQINLLKMKLQEVKQQLKIQQDELSEEEASIKQISKKIIENEKRLTLAKNESINALQNNMIQDAFWKKAQENCNKIDLASKNMSTIGEECKEKEFNLSDERKVYLENILARIQQLKKQTDLSKLDTSIISNTAKIGRDKISMQELLQFLSQKAVEDLQKLQQQIYGPDFLNELNLLLYEIDSVKMDEANTDRIHQNLTEKARQIYSEFIRLKCKTVKFNRDNQIVLEKIKEVKPKISEFCRKNLQAPNMPPYNQFMKNYIALKRAEENNRQLESFLRNIEGEVNYLTKKSDLMEVKMESLETLSSNIHFKQVQLEELIRENFSLLASESSNKATNMKVVLESILGSARIFLCDQFYQKSLDYTLAGNMSHLNLTTNESNNNTLMKSFNQFKSKFKAEKIKVGLGINAFDWEQRTVLEKLFDNYELQGDRVVFDRLNEFCVNLRNKFDEVVKPESDELSEIDENHSELLIALHNCQHFDKNELFKFVDMIRKKIKDFVEFKKEYEELEGLLSNWWEQPASNCTIDEITHNGKTIDYYLDLIREAIVKMEHSKRFMF